MNLTLKKRLWLNKLKYLPLNWEFVFIKPNKTTFPHRKAR